MSWVVTITVWCDGKGCPQNITNGSASVDETRRVARSQGWALLYGTMDVCPFHNERGPDAELPPEMQPVP